MESTHRCRNFWRYLREIEKTSAELQPFVVPSFTNKTSNKATPVKGGWVPFTSREVVTLLNAAIEKQDQELTDLIRFGMYSRARIKELCALKANYCTEGASGQHEWPALTIADSKMDAGVRTVPVHSELVAVVDRLKKSSTNEYLLSGLTFNKYGDRSNVIGKRFGRLKQALGFPDEKVFHSIRKIVVTLLENTGISAKLTTDIVGHEKRRITYGCTPVGTRWPP